MKKHNLKYNNEENNILFKNTYCLVVDHTTMVYESIVRGIPVFYLGQNREECLGNDIFITDYNLFNPDNIDINKLPDRMSFLRKYFSGMITYQELEDNKLSEYINNYNKSIFT